MSADTCVGSKLVHVVDLAGDRVAIGMLAWIGMYVGIGIGIWNTGRNSHWDWHWNHSISLLESVPKPFDPQQLEQKKTAEEKQQNRKTDQITNRNPTSKHTLSFFPAFGLTSHRIDTQHTTKTKCRTSSRICTQDGRLTKQS